VLNGITGFNTFFHQGEKSLNVKLQENKGHKNDEYFMEFTEVDPGKLLNITLGSFIEVDFF